MNDDNNDDDDKCRIIRNSKYQFCAPAKATMSARNCNKERSARNLGFILSRYLHKSFRNALRKNREENGRFTKNSVRSL